MSDFSLMDAIESGIVKLTRAPVADNIPGAAMPRYDRMFEQCREAVLRDHLFTGELLRFDQLHPDPQRSAPRPLDLFQRSRLS